MRVKSRRKAREAALRVLYGIEIGGGTLRDALQTTMAEAQLDSDLFKYACNMVETIYQDRRIIDERLAKLVTGYDFDRIAAVDRSLLRIGYYELFYEDGIPPAVTLNEIIDIAKKYSTAESGRFVNGVLGRALEDSPKANWDRSIEEATAPIEDAPEPEPDIPVEEIESEEAFKEVAKVGLWKLRNEDES